MSRKKRIVVLGGGTGSYTVLSGLKKYPVSLTAIVTMADNGGSNRAIRDEFGLLPTSDIRQCLVALACGNGTGDQLMRQLFMYRFHQGKGIVGMTFGNLFMAALSDILGSQKKAIQKTGEILNIQGQVLPVTFTDTNLGAVYENGKRIIGENSIDEPKHNMKLKIRQAFLRPLARANPEALEAIHKADLVVIGPGDLYTSIVSNLLVKGVPEAIRKTKAKVVYVVNLMTRPGQTYDFTAKDHLSVLEQYLGKAVDVVLVNSKSVSKATLQRYKREFSIPVSDDLNNAYYRVIRGDFLHAKEIKKVRGDSLHRSLIRHNPDKLARLLLRVLG
ncbi:MAG: YvcK family protein [bacterium]|nr:YvcK family protein [bacterium]MDZ4231668.1 gluconeogenesis factor YvcK family protein [Candidatus Pacearchaeota archaeon]